MKLAKIKSWLLQALFPEQCLGCGLEGEGICDICLKAIPRFNPANDQVFCAEHGITSITSLMPYKSKPIKRLIKNLKFHARESLLSVLRQLLAAQPQNLPAVDAVIPVPTTPRRQRERDFDHVASIASHLAEQAQVPLLLIVQTARHHKRQSHMKSHQARHQNIQGAFTLSQVSPKRVMIVDDVFTSGATVAEIAKLLRQAGAEEIHVFTLARSGKKE